MPAVKLTYFNLRGRGELPRLLLAYARVKYQDQRITVPWEDPKPWEDLKPTTPFGQLPLLEWDGEKLAQCLGVSRFLAKEFGLTGRNNKEAAQADEIVYAVQDVLAYGWDAMFEEEEVRRNTMLGKYREKMVPDILSKLEARLIKRGGQFLVGNILTWADIQTFFFCSELGLTWNKQDELQDYPGVSGLMRRVENLPNIKEWIHNRPSTTGPDGGSL